MILRKLAIILGGLVLAFMPAAMIAQTLPPPPVVASPRLYVLDCGTAIVSDPGNGLTRAQVKNVVYSDMCFLIVHPKGTLLWDSGLPDRYYGRPPYEHNRGAGFGKARHAQQIVLKTLLGQLADLGYSPDMITYHALSHFHFDHSGNSNAFARSSTWITNRAEWDVMFAPVKSEYSKRFIYPDRPVEGYEDFKDLEHAKTIFVDQDNYDIFGDGSVTIVRASGHTPGHSVLMVKLPHTGNVILAGDLYHHPEELTHDLDFDPDASASRASRAKVIKLAEDNNAKIWASHDVDTFRSLRKSPDFYD